MRNCAECAIEVVDTVEKVLGESLEGKVLCGLNLTLGLRLEVAVLCDLTLVLVLLRRVSVLFILSTVTTLWLFDVP